jgi:predicted ATPase/DNA-binding CsgD family transcriptional regulator
MGRPGAAKLGVVAMPHQLPTRYHTPFVGRTSEQAEIAARLLNAECRLLTLTGLGGSGKTRLAIEVATQLADQFTHGTIFVALQPIPRADLIPSAIAQTIGLTFYAQTEQSDQLFAYLHDKTALVILDNFEHLLDGTAFISDLLAVAPRVTVLVTSREALRLQEEWLYPLNGLQTPPSIYSTSLEDYESVELFLAHARRIRPTFDLATEREAVIRICKLTSGLPLALELAASWLAGLHTAHIVQALEHTPDLLATTARNVEPRHRSMWAVFDQSWELLAAHERLSFARLSVFRGGFARDAAEQVAGASLTDLAVLVEKSLIQLEYPDRFGMHELLRQYGADQLTVLGESEATKARHSRYYADMLRHHEQALKQSQQLETMQVIEREFENIRLAWEWSAQNRQVDFLDAMVESLYLFGFLRSRYHERIAMFQQALGQLDTHGPLFGRLLARRWGYLHWWFQADYSEAMARIEQALAIAQAEQNDVEIAFGHLMAAYALSNMRRYREALPRLETSRTLFDRLDEPYYVCWVLHRLGYVYYNLKNSNKGNSYTEQSLALARGMHNRIALVICLYNLGSDYIMNGHYAQGRQYCGEALHVATEAGHQGQIGHALSLLALCDFCQGDFAACQESAQRSWAIIEDITMLIFQPYNLALLMLLACVREEYAEAVRLKDLEQHHNTNTMGFQLLYWAFAALSCGLGNLADARTAIQNLVELTTPHADSAATLWIVPCAACILAADDPTNAIEMLAWVFDHPDPSLNWARQWPLIGRLRDQLHTKMAHDVYQAHWERGNARTVANITTYLHREFGTRSDELTDTDHDALLTSREREILALLAAGKTNPQIAAELIIGAGTVKTHTINIYRKLDVANRTQAIVRARALGLLPS